MTVRYGSRNRRQRATDQLAGGVGRRQPLGHVQVQHRAARVPGLQLVLALEGLERVVGEARPAAARSWCSTGWRRCRPAGSRGTGGGPPWRTGTSCPPPGWPPGCTGARSTPGTRTIRARTWSSSRTASACPSGSVRSWRSPVKLRTISLRPLTPIVEKWLSSVAEVAPGVREQPFVEVARDDRPLELERRPRQVQQPVERREQPGLVARRAGSPSRAQLTVTTPSEPVCSADPNSPLPRLSSSRRSSCRRQHIERTSPGLISELRKFWKYGSPYRAVIANRRSAFSLCQSKSGVMLYVGIGNVKTRPDASPSVMTSMYARLIRSISACRSP